MTALSGAFLWLLLPTWVYVDARGRGVRRAWLFAFLTAISVLVGLVVYLIARPEAPAALQCPGCGREVDGAAWCPHCGHDLSASFCGTCRYPLKADWAFCPACRTEIKPDGARRPRDRARGLSSLRGGANRQAPLSSVRRVERAAPVRAPQRVEPASSLSSEVGRGLCEPAALRARCPLREVPCPHSSIPLRPARPPSAGRSC